MAAGTGAHPLLLHAAHGEHARKEGWGRDAEVSPRPWLSCPWTWRGGSKLSPKALPLLVPVVKEEKSLVLPWAREV